MLSCLGLVYSETDLWRCKFKIQNPDNDTITDNVAASAYVEQFAMEVFNRGEATMNANKVTRYYTLLVHIDDN